VQDVDPRVLRARFNEGWWQVNRALPDNVEQNATKACFLRPHPKKGNLSREGNYGIENTMTTGFTATDSLFYAKRRDVDKRRWSQVVSMAEENHLFGSLMNDAAKTDYVSLNPPQVTPEIKYFSNGMETAGCISDEDGVMSS